MKKSEYKNGIESKRKICAAYLTLLTQNKTFSVTDIVKQANINRGTFYLHFSNIQDVEQSIDEELANNFKIVASAFRKVELDKTPEILVNKLNEILAKDLEFYRLMIQAKDAYTLMNKIKTHIQEAISNNFMIMRYVTNYENFKIIVQYIVSGVIDTYIDWFKGNINCTLDELSELLCKMIKGGLKGYLNYAM